jgi:hypothetical protein
VWSANGYLLNMSEKEIDEVSAATRTAESEDAEARHVADRPATGDEADLAEQEKLEDGVAEHYRDMTDRGVNEPGEGRIA